MNGIWTIYLKELLEVLRDRRTLIFMVLLPTLIFPIIIEVSITVMARQAEKEDAKVTKTAIVNADSLPDLHALIEDTESFEVIEGYERGSLSAAIRNEEIDLGLVFPAEAEELREAGYQLEIEAVHDNAAILSQSLKRIEGLVAEHSKALREQKLRDLGVASYQFTGVLDPVRVKPVGIAEQRELLGERIGGFLPYFLILFCFAGALYPAIDIAAGEKERGTLETLLLTPVPRAYLVLGKFLVVFTTGIVSSVLSLTSMGVWIALKGNQIGDELGEVISSVSPVDLFLVGFMQLPLAAIFAAILLAISVYAKSFKEAQSLATPLNFLVIIPAMLAMLPGVELSWGWAMVPVTNVALAIKELVKGTIDYALLGGIFGSTALIAAVMVFSCIKWFTREDVLFRS